MNSFEYVRLGLEEFIAEESLFAVRKIDGYNNVYVYTWLCRLNQFLKKCSAFDKVLNVFCYI